MMHEEGSASGGVWMNPMIKLPPCITLLSAHRVTGSDSSRRTSVCRANKAHLCLSICNGPCSRRDCCLVTVWSYVCVQSCKCVWIRGAHVWLTASSKHQLSFLTLNGREKGKLWMCWCMSRRRRLRAAFWQWVWLTSCVCTYLSMFTLWPGWSAVIHRGTATWTHSC